MLGLGCQEILVIALIFGLIVGPVLLIVVLLRTARSTSARAPSRTVAADAVAAAREGRPDRRVGGLAKECPRCKVAAYAEPRGCLFWGLLILLFPFGLLLLLLPRTYVCEECGYIV